MTAREELIDAGAEAGWHDEAMRATGKPRFEDWRDQSDATREKWRRTAEAVLLRFEAHGGGCVVVPRHGTRAMIDAARQEFGIVLYEIIAANAASPYAPEAKP